MRSPRPCKPPLQNKDDSHSFGGSLNDHSHTGPNLQIIPCLNQHIPQSILNGFPLLLITLITSTYLLANGHVNLCDDYHLVMKGEGCNLIRGPILLCAIMVRVPFYYLNCCFNTVEEMGSK